MPSLYSRVAPTGFASGLIRPVICPVTAHAAQTGRRKCVDVAPGSARSYPPKLRLSMIDRFFGSCLPVT